MPLDVSDVHAFTRRALAEFDDMPKNVFGFVEAGAEILQATDIYTDRSGDLREHTQAVNVTDDVDQWHFTLELDMPYASFVNDRGFSRVDEVGQEGGVVDTEIGVYLNQTMPSRMGR